MTRPLKGGIYLNFHTCSKCLGSFVIAVNETALQNDQRWKENVTRIHLSALLLGWFLGRLPLQHQQRLEQSYSSHPHTGFPNRMRGRAPVFLVKIWRLTLAQTYMSLLVSITVAERVGWGGYQSQPNHTVDNEGKWLLKEIWSARQKDHAILHVHPWLPNINPQLPHILSSKGGLFQCVNHVKWLFMAHWSVGE